MSILSELSSGTGVSSGADLRVAIFWFEGAVSKIDKSSYAGGADADRYLLSLPRSKFLKKGIIFNTLRVFCFQVYLATGLIESLRAKDRVGLLVLSTLKGPTVNNTHAYGLTLFLYTLSNL